MVKVQGFMRGSVSGALALNIFEVTIHDFLLVQ